jgi:hypothetical protein
MASALVLRNEATKLTGAARDAKLGALFDLLRASPETLTQLTDERTLEARRQLLRGHAAATAQPTFESVPTHGPFRYRNLALGWDAEHAAWGWPPVGDFAPLEQVLSVVMQNESVTPSVHVVGECWGMSSLSHPRRNGGLLLAGKPSHGQPDPARVAWTPGGNLRCLLGATFGELHDFLDRQAAQGGPSKNLANQPGFAGLTLAGNIGMGGHGSGLGLGPLASLVQALELGPIPGGRAHTQALRRGDPGFELALTHLGRLGPVVTMELAVRERFRIAETREVWELEGSFQQIADQLRALLRHIADHADDSNLHSTELWVAPYIHDGKLVVARGERRYTSDAVTHAKRPLSLRCDALVTLGYFAAIAVAVAHPEWIRPILQRALHTTKTSRVVMEAREGLDFGAPNHQDIGSIEMAVEFSLPGAADTLIASLEQLELLSRQDLFVFSPLGLRFVGPAGAEGLAPQTGWAKTMLLEFPSFAGKLFRGHEVLEPLQRSLSQSFRARPHWGQRIYLSGQELARLYPAENIQAFRALAQAADPKELFATPLLDALFAAVP